MEFAGEFETHLTLEAQASADRVAQAEAWARDHGLKFTHIELDRGATPSQPMVTHHGSGTLSGVLETAAGNGSSPSAAPGRGRTWPTPCSPGSGRPSPTTGCRRCPPGRSGRA